MVVVDPETRKQQSARNCLLILYPKPPARVLVILGNVCEVVVPGLEKFVYIVVL